jgi:hypothetical protein
VLSARSRDAQSTNKSGRTTTYADESDAQSEDR